MTTLRKFIERLDRQANDGHGWDKAPQMLRDAAANLRRAEALLNEMLTKGAQIDGWTNERAAWMWGNDVRTFLTAFDGEVNGP